MARRPKGHKSGCACPFCGRYRASMARRRGSGADVAPWHRGRTRTLKRCKALTKMKGKNGRRLQCKHKTRQKYCRVHRGKAVERQGTLLARLLA